MSNPPPPPPGDDRPPPPPGAAPPPPPPGAPPQGQPPQQPGYPAQQPGYPPQAPPPGYQPPPPGYVAYGTPVAHQSMLQSTSGLRLATVILVWVATAATGLQMLAVFNRRSVWNDPSSSLGDLLDADDAVAGAFVLYAIAALATVIVLSIWTYRAVGNAQRLGAPAVRPGLACGGWYIPFGNVFVPYVQLRKAGRFVGASQTGTTLWQIGWGAMVVGGVIVNLAVNEGDVFDPDAISDDLTTQATGAAILFVAAIVAAVGATMSTKALDEAVSRRAS